MRDMKLVEVDEPFTKLLTQGMVLNEAFVRSGDGAGKDYYWAHDLDIVRDDHAHVVSATAKVDGAPVHYEGWTTMSKSKNNGVDPQELIAKYGADTARLFVMFASPPEQTLEWNDSGVEGAHRFIKRVWNLGTKRKELAQEANSLSSTSLSDAGSDVKELRRQVHLILKQASFDYERMQYNTVVSACMKLLNTLESFEPEIFASVELKEENSGQIRAAALTEGYGILLRVLYPACPHLTHVLWQQLGYAAQKGMGDLLDAPWPQVDDAALVQDEIELMLQVNGKLRGSIKVSASADKATIEAAALASEDVAKFSEGKPPKKIIVVPGRLVNVVV
jgi:leucyl-tRNA synthetase